MSDWRFQGSAQRRRMGAPSSHLEGGAVARSNIPTPDEALAGMARVGSPRQPMGQDGFAFDNASATPSPNTSPRPRGNTQAGDPVGNTKSNRQAVPYPTPAGMGDRNGAAFRISASFPPHTAPEAGATQASGRIISAAKPELGNFSQEQGYSRA